MKNSTKEQKEAFNILLDVLQEKGKQYVCAQGQTIEWFTVKEINKSPFYEIQYKHESFTKVRFGKKEDHFMIVSDMKVCNDDFLSNADNLILFKKEIKVSYLIASYLQEMYWAKKGHIIGYSGLVDNDCPLAAFKKCF